MMRIIAPIGVLSSYLVSRDIAVYRGDSLGLVDVTQTVIGPDGPLFFGGLDPGITASPLDPYGIGLWMILFAFGFGILSLGYDGIWPELVVCAFLAHQIVVQWLHSTGYEQTAIRTTSQISGSSLSDAAQVVRSQDPVFVSVPLIVAVVYLVLSVTEILIRVARDR